MHPPLLVLSGPIASGKSTLAKKLERHHQAMYVTTRDPLNRAAQPPNPGRQELQDAGTHLDQSTNGTWVLTHLQQMAVTAPHTPLIVLDCIRNTTQLGPITQHWPAPTLHVHLTATPGILTQRYTQRGDELPHTQALDHPAEQGIADLEPLADLVVDTSDISPGQAAELVMTKLKAATLSEKQHGQHNPQL